MGQAALTGVRDNEAKQISALHRQRGYEASLEIRKLYETIPDKEAQRHNQVRVIDESGEDYLYPSRFFATVRLSIQTKNRMLERAA